MGATFSELDDEIRRKLSSKERLEAASYNLKLPENNLETNFNRYLQFWSPTYWGDVEKTGRLADSYIDNLLLQCIPSEFSFPKTRRCMEASPGAYAAVSAYSRHQHISRRLAANILLDRGFKAVNDDLEQFHKQKRIWFSLAKGKGLPEWAVDFVKSKKRRRFSGPALSELLNYFVQAPNSHKKRLLLYVSVDRHDFLKCIADTWQHPLKDVFPFVLALGLIGAIEDSEDWLEAQKSTRAELSTSSGP